MVVVLELSVDVAIVADSEDAELLARRVTDEVIGQARTAIAHRLTRLEVEVSIR